MTDQTIALRHATAADERALKNLAALDGQRLPAGPFLVAEIDGELRSALSLSDGAVIADPFRHTAHTVDLLRAHGAASRPRRVSRVRLRPAFGF